MRKSLPPEAWTGRPVRWSKKHRKRITLQKNNTASANHSPRSYSRHTRVWLFSLLILTTLFATGALFVKYKLETLRQLVQREAETRTGTRVQMGAVLVDGLHGLRIDDLVFSMASASGPSLRVEVPVAYIYVDIADLLNGKVTVTRIQVDHARMHAERPQGQRWIPRKDSAPPHIPWWIADRSFRVTGSECRLEVLNVVSTTKLLVDAFAFDVGRLPDSPNLSARVSGNLGGDPAKKVQLDLRYASLEDFDLRLVAAQIAAADVNVFLPATQHFVQSGVSSPTIRLGGYPDNKWVASLESRFEDLTIRNQPEFFGPATGALTVLANYDVVQRTLTIATAKAESDQLNGTLEGSVRLDEDVPHFDLRLAATQLPVEKILDYILAGRSAEYGQLAVALDEPSEIAVALSGTTESPLISATARVASGMLTFVPTDSRFPSGTLQLGASEGSWDSETKVPKGSISVTGGEVNHPPSGVSAKRVSGVIHLDNQCVSVDALNAEITGNPFVGTFRYDIAAKQTELTLNGMVSGIENTPLATAIKNTRLAGAAIVRGKVVETGGRFSAEATIDATQTEVGYEWWFNKTAGIGANGAVKANYVPAKSAHVDAELTVAGTPLQAQLDFSYVKPKMKLQTLKATSPRLDVVAIGRCLRLPYTVGGGTGADAYYEWRRTDAAAGYWTAKTGGVLDDFSLQAEGSAAPSTYHNARVEAVMDKSEHSQGNLTVHAEQAAMPPFKEKWFVPLLSDPELLAQYPQTPRAWSYQLSADALTVPPWKGTGFKGEAVSGDGIFELRSYGADIGEGRLDGTYRSDKAQNTYTTTASWTKVPASFFLDHLGFPRVLAGDMTGTIAYSMDRDDPATRKGQGAFSIEGGQFSADFVSKLLEGRAEGEMEALPPSLKFTHLSTDLAFDKDSVQTPNLRLTAKGIELDGKGGFVIDGDMNYDLKASIAPETAEKIPALVEYFNVQGHRLSQQNIVLTFHVSGPTFNPTGRVARLPSPSVTLVSGALEVTSEAMKVIEIPRKILVDLLKIGGGIVGAGPSP